MSSRRPRQLAFARLATGRYAEPGRTGTAQLSIHRCPYCPRFLAYSGTGRPPVTCGGAACRSGRRRERRAGAAGRRLLRAYRLLLFAAAYRLSRSAS